MQFMSNCAMAFRTHTGTVPVMSSLQHCVQTPLPTRVETLLCHDANKETRRSISGVVAKVEAMFFVASGTGWT